MDVNVLACVCVRVRAHSGEQLIQIFLVVFVCLAN